MDIAKAPNAANISAAFGDDDHELQSGLECAIAACSRATTREACAHFALFAAGLRRHMRAEDNVLFPAFEAHTGLRDGGPTTVMRRDHREFEERLQQIGESLRRGEDAAVAEQRLLALRDRLADHDRREEMVLYPTCDRLLNARVRFACVHALPRIRLAVCHESSMERSSA